MKLFIRFAVPLLLVLSMLSCQKSKKYDMWASDEIPASEIDKVVAEEMNNINRTYITIDENKFRPVEADADDGKVLVIFEQGTAFLGFKFPEIKPDGTVKLVLRQNNNTPAKQGTKAQSVFYGSKLKVINKKSDFLVRGTVIDSLNQKKHLIEILINESVIWRGTTRLKIKNEKAILTGVLGARSYVQIKNLINNHPEIHTLVLQDVPGSMNDPINMHTGRLIRKAGLTILVPANSEIASGGVDLFCSGKKRIVEPGAKLGIHSWYGNGFSAADLPKDDPAHNAQIHYCTEMLGAKGKAFYFRTLEAAPPDSIHWMTGDELNKWGLIAE